MPKRILPSGMTDKEMTEELRCYREPNRGSPEDRLLYRVRLTFERLTAERDRLKKERQTYSFEVTGLKKRVAELETAMRELVDTDARHCGRAGVRDAVLKLGTLVSKVEERRGGY